jgi:mono/diheme cytochrome c family protein
MQGTILSLILGSLILMQSASVAQEAGDIAAGGAFAREACASCHATQPKVTTSPTPNAPPFQQVADTSGMTATALTVWLQTSHPTMPNLQLTPVEKRDVIAYILSLRRQRE